MSENLTKKQEIEHKLQNLFPDPDKAPLDILVNYRKAAAVLDYFDFNEINPLNGKNNLKEALDSLLSVSRLVFDENNNPFRALSDSVRRDVLETLIRENGVAEALDANPRRPSTDFQKLLERCLLTDEILLLNQFNQQQLLACSKVAEMLAGLVENIPKVEEIRRQIEITNLLDPLKFLLGISDGNPSGSFFGRQKELSRLSDYVGFRNSGSVNERFRRGVSEVFGFAEKPPLYIYAPGGMGKSTLLAKFTLEHARFDDSEKIAFVYLDFDRAGITIEEPVTLLIEAIQQLIVQFPENQVSLKELQSRWFRRLNNDDQTSLEKTVTKGQVFRVKNHYTYIREFAYIVKDLAIENKPLLFVLDTFEEVQYRSSVYVEELLSFLNELLGQLPTLRVILSGRAEIKSKEFKLEPFALERFDKVAAQAYLMKNGVTDKNAAAALAEQFGGFPLTLKLVTGLYKAGGADAAGISDIKTTEWFFKAEEEVIQGQLYDRILERIRNKEIRKLVHPGLVLRRITPEVIRDVLAIPCEVEVPDISRAQALFQELEKEITLVVPQGAKVLVHRPDVRRVILGLMKKNKPHIVGQIHLNAIEYYRNFDDKTSLTEEIYHRLSIDFDRRTLSERWIQGLHFSKDDVEELPLQSQIFLAARIGLELDDEIWKQAELEDWLLYAQRRASELNAVEKPAEALELIEERIPVQLINSPLRIIQIEALKRLKNYTEAHNLAARGKSAATRQGDTIASAEFIRQLQEIESHIEPVNEEKTMSSKSVANKPFGDIALCLSGGGYRAATYALGTLVMLDELNLLDDVKLLSTVSGGTFTGLTYATWQSEGKSFNEFYKDFSDYLKTTNAIDKALNYLYTTPSPSGSTDLSLIRSAAKSYGDCLLGERTFKQLMEVATENGRFRELIFNSTEFREGNSFRFRASSDKTVFIGNQNFAVPKDVAEEIHLADIVAASSCFPGAFEPLRFPDDFYWQSPLDTIRGKLIKDVENPFADRPVYPNGFKNNGNCLPLPLMDGGIYDNQGITNAVMANRNNNFGLFLITDTSARDDDILNLPDASPRRGLVSLGTLFWCAIVLFIISLISIGIIGYSFFYKGEIIHFQSWQIIIGYIVSIAPAFLLIGVLTWIYSQFRKLETFEISGAKFGLWHYFKKMALPDAIEFIKSRVNSVLAMTSNVFMKRIRQLQFNNLMSAESRTKLVTFNLIYDLNPSIDRAWLWKLDPQLQPTRRMKEVSAKAEITPTTLWMNEEQFNILIDCGRCTTCFSLLKYLWQRWQEEEREAQKQSSPLRIPKPNTPESQYYEIYTILKTKWLELQKIPN